MNEKTLTDRADRDIASQKWLRRIILIAILLPSFPLIIPPIPQVLNLWVGLRGGRVDDVVFYALFIVVFFWPIILFAFRASAKLRSSKYSLMEATWATKAGLVGLLLPYVFGYSVFYGFFPIEIASAVPVAGGLGFAILLVGFLFLGGALAVVGWSIGRLAAASWKGAIRR